MSMIEQDGQQDGRPPKGGDSADDLRWLWIRLGLRLGIALLVIVATLLLILGEA